MINIQWHMGLWVTTGSVSLNLMEEGGWRSNVIQDPQTKRGSLHQHTLGIHPLISKTVDASVSKRSPQHTPLLTGKSTPQPKIHTASESQKRAGGGSAMLWKQHFNIFFFVFVRPCCVVRLPQIKGLIFDAFAFAVAEVALRQHDQ